MEELPVPQEVLELIAAKMVSNIRELEGALIKVIAYASLTGEEISLSLVETILKDIMSPVQGKSFVDIALIKKLVAEYYSVKLEDMTAKSRTKEKANARQVAMYLARTMTSISLPKIGEEFGGRDHTTVMHACDKVSEDIKSNPDIDDAVKTITNNILSHVPGKA
jgi:chromosomal replication initiator protein